MSKEKFLGQRYKREEPANKGRTRIQTPQGEIINQKLKNMERIRRIGWVVCLILISVLTIVGVKPGMAAFRQAMGVRGLLQASVGLSNDELANPFMCMRDTVNSAQVQAALVNISDGYLRGVGLCMAGEGEAGMEALREAGGQSNAEVQYAAGLIIKDFTGKGGCVGSIGYRWR